MSNKLSLAALVAALATLGLACGDPDGGTGTGAVCVADADCKATEICHPTAKVCVTKCDAAADCPAAAPTCSALASASASSKFCQCSSDTTCGGGTGSTAVCSTADKICQTKCSSSADCAGRPCNATTGQCQNSTVGQTCSATAAQPDACDNGQFCTGAAPVCTAVPAASCANFSSSTHSATWVATNNAPVIWDVSNTGVTNNPTFCGAGAPFRFKAHVKAYWKNAAAGNFGTTGATLEPQVHLVRADGTEISPTDTTQNVAVTNTGKNLEFDFNLCRASNASFPVGLHFSVSSVTGNETCVTLQ